MNGARRRSTPGLTAPDSMSATRRLTLAFHSGLGAELDLAGIEAMAQELHELAPLVLGERASSRILSAVDVTSPVDVPREPFATGARSRRGSRRLDRAGSRRRTRLRGRL